VRLVLLGSGAFGRPAFERLTRAHDVVLVVTQPDRPAGRGRRLTPTPVGAWAEEAGLPHLKTADASGADREGIRAASADAWVVIAFGQKLSPELLADRFAVNLHASLLPRWRGAAPINHAILGGDDVTGNSVITLADRMDAGLVLGQRERRIEPSQTAGDLHDLLAADGPDLVERVLAERAAGTLAGAEQDESLVTPAPKLDKTRDGWVDFSASAEECRRRINGLSPWPAATVRFRGAPLKLLRAEPVGEPAQEGAAGEIVDAGGGVAACGSGAVRVLEAQAPGKPRMEWSRVAQSLGVERGERLEGRARC